MWKSVELETYFRECNILLYECDFGHSPVSEIYFINDVSGVGVSPVIGCFILTLLLSLFY